MVAYGGRVSEPGHADWRPLPQRAPVGFGPAAIHPDDQPLSVCREQTAAASLAQAINRADARGGIIRTALRS